MTTKYVVKYYP